MGVRVIMANPENRIFCRLDGLTPGAREQKRLTTLKELDLLAVETVALFDEATQIAARFLDAPICILGFMTLDQVQIKSAVGLSTVGLMNPLAQLRQLPRQEGFCTYVVETHQVLAIHDTRTNPVFSSSLLVQHYGISAYLGAPLFAADGQCLGTLAVMDWEPRDFTTRDKEFLAITARWCMSEYERNHVLKEHPTSSLQRLSKPSLTEPDNQEQKPNFIADSWGVNSLCDHFSSMVSLKVKLLTQLTQELRTPLTSVMGMASVLNRQVYGPLTSKQKEYLEIIHHSGQHLVSLVDEIVALNVLDEISEQLDLTSVDIDMLCQQAIHSLFKIANQRQQQIRLSVEPGSRIWLLDKNKVRQILYHLVFSVIHSAQTGSEIRIHVSRRNDKLNIAVWVFHPWLGDSLPRIYEGIASLSTTDSATGSDILETSLTMDKLKSSEFTASDYQLPDNPLYSSPAAWATLALTQEQNQKPWNHDSREALGLLLSCKLAELHKGQISIEGSLESGYRYVVSLPQLELP
jgi:hypothetical protein